MKKFLERNKVLLSILFIIMVVIIGIIILRNIYKTKIYEIDKANYSLRYDSTWKTVKEEEMEANLIHKKSKSQLNIKINEIQDEYQYKTLEELSDNLLYNIQEQNKSYKLIHRETSKITQNNVDGVKMLFETDNSQVIVYFYRQGSKMVVFTYEALFDYFDILLDSVNSIIYSFSINNQSFDVITNINLNTNSINYTEQKDVSSLLTDTISEEIASSNYIVNYSIPSNFKLIEYNTKYGNYKFDGFPIEKNLDLKTNILKCNLYEYLDRENDVSIYKSYNLNSYNRSKEEIDKFGEEPLSYIYKNSYLNNNEMIENIAIIFELNKDHIFIVKISSKGIGIPEDVVKMIKINDIKNIASNIKIEKEDGFLIDKLKKFVDYTNNQTEEITLKVPERYQEIDKDNNLYEKRNYVYNYNKEKGIYESEVSYEINNFEVDTILELLDSEINYLKGYGEYKPFTEEKNIEVNSRKYRVFDRTYTRYK